MIGAGDGLGYYELKFVTLIRRALECGDLETAAHFGGPGMKRAVKCLACGKKMLVPVPRSSKWLCLSCGSEVRDPVSPVSGKL